jgi:heme-degrading monooxygenase HmoA
MNGKVLAVVLIMGVTFSMGGCTSQERKAEFPSVHPSIVEISQFQLAKGVDEQSFLNAANAVQENFLKKQSGFIDRELLRAENGQWVDILHWKTAADAQRAAKEAMNNPTAAEFFQKMDPASVKMMHLEQMRIYR